jgi:hypothetical protein
MRSVSAILGRALMGVLIVGVGVSACSTDHKPSGTPTPSGSASGASGGADVGSAAATASTPDVAPASGTVVLSLGSTVTTLDIQLCIATPGDGVNLTAVGSGSPAPTLVVNLTKPAGGSTLVYTTRGSDNSFTTHSMAPSTSTQASVDQLRVRVSGTAVEQGYSPNGTEQGSPKSEMVTVDGLCLEIRPPNPAPQFESSN